MYAEWWTDAPENQRQRMVAHFDFDMNVEQMSDEAMTDMVSEMAQVIRKYDGILSDWFYARIEDGN